MYVAVAGMRVAGVDVAVIVVVMVVAAPWSAVHGWSWARPWS